MTTSPSDPSPTRQLTYLRLLAAYAEKDHFFDLRWRSSSEPMRRRFIAARRPHDAALLIGLLSPECDVYVGVVPRDGNAHGGRTAISGSHLAWVESDDPRTAQRLASFAHQPTMVVASGTPGHHQVYWLLDRRYSPTQVQELNRRLALTLAGDVACADVTRILRPPDTLNHKHDPPRPVSLLVLREDARVGLEQLADCLIDDPDLHPGGDRAPTRRPAGRTTLERALLAIPSSEYVRVLTGRSADREGKVPCPFHADANPSLQLYADGGFYCFGSVCKKGGTIFDFAGHLWGIAPRGAGFIELRQRLAERFDLTPTQSE